MRVAEELKGERITVNCLHPATYMNTKMVIKSVGYSLSTVEEGLHAVLYLATSPALDHVTGQYFDQRRTPRNTAEKLMCQTPEPDTIDTVQSEVPSDLPIMVPLSVAEIRRLFIHLVVKPPLSFAYHLAWSGFRRTHQALARRFSWHYRARA